MAVVKSLFNDEYQLNDIGKDIKQDCNETISNLFKKYTKDGIDPLQLLLIINQTSLSSCESSMNTLLQFFRNKKYNTSTLEIVCEQTGIIKTAEFLGYGINGYRHWKREPGYKPMVPTGTDIYMDVPSWYIFTKITDGKED